MKVIFPHFRKVFKLFLSHVLASFINIRYIQHILEELKGLLGSSFLPNVYHKKYNRNLDLEPTFHMHFHGVECLLLITVDPFCLYNNKFPNTPIFAKYILDPAFAHCVGILLFNMLPSTQFLRYSLASTKYLIYHILIIMIMILTIHL